MRSPRKIVRRLFFLTLALVSMAWWNTLPISSSGVAVRAASGVKPHTRQVKGVNY